MTVLFKQKMSRSGCETPRTQRSHCIGQGLVPESKDHPASYLAAILDDAVGPDPHGLTDCQSAGIRSFAGNMIGPVCQSCARFRIQSARENTFGSASIAVSWTGGGLTITHSKSAVSVGFRRCLCAKCVPSKPEYWRQCGRIWHLPPFQPFL
jgi:hypothetical protein